MKKLSQVFSKLKNVNDEMFLNVEKITVINRNKIYIQNYQEIYEIDDEFIKLSKITIKGKNLKLLSISKYFLEISGEILDINLGDAYEKQ
ncbi:YabP/YqfC family sporulation protein [Mycoplasmatota bacterium]|nr:YabP/YqfC family sporulation protein [Mycoplasmatota bacterium]